MKPVFLLLFLFLFAGCGSGGSDAGPVTENGSVADSTSWEARADVTLDGCRERISAVRQIFSLNGDSIQTGIIALATTKTATGFSFGFEEANGNCLRNYKGEFSDVSATSATVQFVAISSCDGTVCENQWSGTATRMTP